jgi:hypothetical protein
MSGPGDRDLPPLPDELGALFAAERAAGNAVAPAKVDAALGRLALQLGGPGGGGGGGDGSGGAGADGVGPGAKVVAGLGVPKVVAIALATFAVGIGTGAAIVSAVRPPSAAPVTSRSEEPSASAVATFEPRRASPSSPPVATPSSLPSADLTTAPVPPGRRLTEGVDAAAAAAESERVVLDAASAALREGDAARALHLLRQHEREYPHGAFDEERESLAVRALAESGDRPAAAARAARFRERYPASVYRNNVDRAVPPAPP